MDKLIHLSDACDLMEKYASRNPDVSSLCYDIRYGLMRLPTISPDEVRDVGEWEDAKQHGLCRCSVCKDCYIEKDYITQAKWKYCPSCGARMTRAEAEKAMEVSEDA